MRNVDLMRINLLEYKLKEKKAVRHLAKMITAYCLIALLMAASYYAIFSKMLEEQLKAEGLNQQLQKEYQQLVSSCTVLNNSQYKMRQNLIDQLNKESISMSPQLVYLHAAAGNEINITSIVVNGDEVSITADADNSEKVKSYMVKITDSVHFGSLKEFKFENNSNDNKTKFMIKAFRRP
jgi:Tfp pilus assembly protein PilN